MSHVATIDLQIKDLDCLKKAALRLGLEFIKDKKQYKWYGRHVGDYPLPKGFSKADLGRCDHVLSILGNDTAYQIGIVDQGKEFKLLWDFWNGGFGLEEKVGKDAGLLKQAYAVEVAKKQAIRDGFRIKETITKSGKILLRATK
jgi:hypothetical protein